MIRNQLVDSDFNYPNHTWVIDNAKLRSKSPFSLVSSKSSFGIHQTLYLRNPGRYYFRIDVKALKYVKEVIVGVLIDDAMKAAKYYVPVSIFRSVSVIIDVKDVDKPVSLYIIAVSNSGKSYLEFEKPVMYCLDDIAQRFALKSTLDKKLEYTPSYSYDNILPTANFDLSTIRCICDKSTSVFPVKTGEIGVETTSSIDILRRYNLIKDHRYLIKILKEEVNSQGKFIIGYNNSVSNKLSSYQEYIIFNHNGYSSPYIRLTCKPKSKVPYRVILKRMILVDITDITFSRADIKSLLYVE